MAARTTLGQMSERGRSRNRRTARLAASGIMGAFKGIWRDSWGPRLEYILHNAVSALLDCENATLLGVNRMLTDPGYLARVVAQVKDPFIRSFWTDEYEGYDPCFQREAIAPIQNKLGQFLLNPVIRNILGQVKSKVSIPFIMDTGRLFLAEHVGAAAWQGWEMRKTLGWDIARGSTIVTDLPDTI